MLLKLFSQTSVQKGNFHSACSHIYLFRSKTLFASRCMYIQTYHVTWENGPYLIPAWSASQISNMTCRTVVLLEDQKRSFTKYVSMRRNKKGHHLVYGKLLCWTWMSLPIHIISINTCKNPNNKAHSDLWRERSEQHRTTLKVISCVIQAILNCRKPVMCY